MTHRRQHACTLALFGLVSVAFSWPLATDPGGLHVSRQLDLYSLVWLLDALGSGGAGLSSEATAWPVGEDLNRMDSFVIAGLAWLGQGMLSGRLLAGLVALLGPVASAFAAERVAAKHFGARWPWSIIAGLGYGFTGMAATSLLEGHVYALLNPWLPLLLGAMLSTLRPEGTKRDGAMAALWWSLCLLTSAYAGIAATLLVLTVAIGSRFWQREDWAPAIVAGGGMVAVRLVYTLVFNLRGTTVRATTQGMSSDPLEVMRAGSIQLDSLAAWTGVADLQQHSLTGALGFTMLCLSLMAPLVLRRTPRLLVVLALMGVLLALGPQIQLSDGGPHIPGPIALLGLLGDRASFFQFPSRMLWLTHLALGILGAAVASKLAERVRPRWSLPLIALAAVDVLIVTGTPLRTQAIPHSTPGIYAQAPADRAILELWPDFGSFGTDLALFTKNLGCTHQSAHGRPLSSKCLGTTIGSSTGALGRWLNSSAYQRSLVADLPKTLGELGFGAVIVHPDLYGPQDREAMLEALTQALGAPAGSSTDAGQHLVMFHVPEVETSPALRALRFVQIEAAYP
jgi:hypothetical protein